MACNERGLIRTTCREVSLETMQALLRSGVQWAYVTCLNRADLLLCNPGLPATWPQGRAFGKELEVRWQQQGNGLYRVDVLTEDPVWRPSEGNWQYTALDVDGCRERTILLWGEMGKDSTIPPEWIEVRIPQALHYPLADVEHPIGNSARPLLRVIVHGYDYTVGGVPVATRWAVLEQDQRGVRSDTEEA